MPFNLIINGNEGGILSNLNSFEIGFVGIIALYEFMELCAE